MSSAGQSALLEVTNFAVSFGVLTLLFSMLSSGSRTARWRGAMSGRVQS